MILRITAITGLLLSFLLRTEAHSVAYFDFNERCKTAYQNIYELEFQAANALIQAEKKEHPDNLIPDYLNHYILFLKTFIGEEQQDFSALKSSSDRLNKTFGGPTAVSPYKNYLLAEINLMTAFNKIKFKEFVGSALEVRRAFKLLEENNRNYPEFILNYKCLGLLHAFIGAVPENYQWLVTIAGMSGTIQSGINELKQVYESSASIDSEFNFMHRETGFIYLFTGQQLQPDINKALNLLQQMNVTNNPLEIFFACNLYYSAGKSEKVLDILNKFKYPDSSYPIYYLSYIKGLAELGELNPESFSNFNNYVKLYKGNSFIKAAYQKMAWTELLKSDTAGYRKWMSLLLTKGNNFTDEDKQAEKEAQSKTIPNVYLLKARILFDGGNYKEALHLLATPNEDDIPSFGNKLEYIYRLARVFDKMNITDQGKTNYEKTIRLGIKSKEYYAAASAVFLAQIYEKEKNFTEAEKYYRQALSMKNHDYQNSLDQKAKAGLNRIRR